MTKKAPKKEGATKPLPNANVRFANFSTHDVKNIAIHGMRYVDEATGKPQYRPTINFFMNEAGEDPLMLSFNLHEFYEDAEVMAQHVVMWATMMFGNVAKLVSIFDPDTEQQIAKFDVMELAQMEDAINELKDIHRTNILRIH